jgi:hypothetical protein
MFLHDFVEIDLPMEVVLDTLAGDVDLPLGQLASRAWGESLASWDGDPLPGPAPAMDQMEVALGALRFRERSVILGLAWSGHGSPWVPTLDADLEIVALGSRRTNLHLLGRYRFGPTVPQWSATDSTVNLLTIISVRRFLTLLADRIGERHRSAQLSPSLPHRRPSSER